MDEDTTDGSGVGQRPGIEAFKLGTVLAGTFLLLVYPGIGIIREIIGQRGIALSPLLIFVPIWVILIAIVRIEPWIQRQPWWAKVEDVWYVGGVVVGLLVPLLVGLLWPLPVLTDLPLGVPTLICAAPLPLVVSAIVARGRRKNRRDGDDQAG